VIVTTSELVVEWSQW